MAINISLMIFYAVFAGDVSVTLFRRQRESIRAGIAGDYVFAILRVKNFQFFNRNAEHFGDLFEIDVLLDHHGIGHDGSFRERLTDVVVLIVVHHVVCSDESGDISTSFRRQVIVYIPEVFFTATGTAQRSVDRTGTAVVRSNSERPVAVGIIKLLEISCGSLRRANRVATLVDERIDRQPHIFSRTNHKLPKPGSTGRRYGVGIERTFDNGKIFKFERHTLFLESLLEEGHIVYAQAEHLLDEPAALSGVHIDVRAHDVVVGHLDDCRERLQSLYIVFLRCRNVVFELNIGVEHGEVFQIPVVAKRLRIGFETIWVDDSIVGDTFFDRKHRRGSNSGNRRAGKDEDCQ